MCGPSQRVIATETDQRTTEPQKERDGSEPGAGRMTAPCTIYRDSNVPKVKVPYWNLALRWTLDSRRKKGRPRENWRRTIETLRNENNREDMERP